MGNRDERTLYVSNLADKVTSNLLEELFVQLSPLEAVYLNEGQHRYALITLNDPDSVQYVCDKLDNIKLWSLPIKVRPKGGTEQLRKYEEVLSRRNPVSSRDQRSYGRGQRNQDSPGLRDLQTRREREERDRRPGNRISDWQGHGSAYHGSPSIPAVETHHQADLYDSRDSDVRRSQAPRHGTYSPHPPQEDRRHQGSYESSDYGSYQRQPPRDQRYSSDSLERSNFSASIGHPGNSYDRSRDYERRERNRDWDARGRDAWNTSAPVYSEHSRRLAENGQWSREPQSADREPLLHNQRIPPWDQSSRRPPQGGYNNGGQRDHPPSRRW